MRARIPNTSAETILLNAMGLREARVWGREPERVQEIDQGERRLKVGGPTPLSLNGPLPPNHPLSDSPSELRAKYA